MKKQPKIVLGDRGRAWDVIEDLAKMFKSKLKGARHIPDCEIDVRYYLVACPAVSKAESLRFWFKQAGIATGVTPTSAGAHLLIGQDNADRAVSKLEAVLREIQKP